MISACPACGALTRVLSTLLGRVALNPVPARGGRWNVEGETAHFVGTGGRYVNHEVTCG